MGDQEKKSSIQALAAGFLGFIGVVGLGGLLILHRGGTAAEAPAASYAPVDGDSGLRAPARSASIPFAAAAGAVASSPAPLLSDEVRDQTAGSASAANGAPAGSAAVDAAAGAGTIPASARLAAAPALDGASSASTSSSVAASTTVAASSQAKAAAAKKPFVAPKLDLSKNQGTVASTVHYGVSDRHELMGRAAGPVYNFAGKGEGQAQSGQVAADNSGAGTAGAIRQMDAAQKQLDSSDAPAVDKAQIDQGLNQVRQTAASAAADQ